MTDLSELARSYGDQEAKAITSNLRLLAAYLEDDCYSLGSEMHGGSKLVKVFGERHTVGDALLLSLFLDDDAAKSIRDDCKRELIRHLAYQTAKDFHIAADEQEDFS